MFAYVPTMPPPLDSVRNNLFPAWPVIFCTACITLLDFYIDIAETEMIDGPQTGLVDTVPHIPAFLEGLKGL